MPTTPIPEYDYNTNDYSTKNRSLNYIILYITKGRHKKAVSDWLFRCNYYIR